MELKDLAQTYRKSSARAIYPGVSYAYGRGKTPNLSRAFDTGNLLTKFISDPDNAFKRIGRKVVNGYVFEVDVAPDGAEYGEYVHFGTKYMNKRPFAELGAEDPKFIKQKDEFMAEKANELVDNEMKTFDEMFKKVGFTIS